MLEYHVTDAGNNLIKIHQKNPLTEVEKKVVLAMYSVINSTDEEEKIYELSICEFYDMLGMQGPNNNFQLIEIMDELLSKVVKISRENGGWVLTHWISSYNYIEDSEMLHFRLSSDLKPYFLQLKNYLTN